MSRKILIVGPSWVGDMVMAQCLFKLLKQNDNHHHITVLAPAWTFTLLKRMPEVSEAIEMPLNHGELKIKTRYAIAKQLRYANYDQAIILPNSLKAGLIPWLAKIPQRTGWLGEWRYFLLNDIRRLDKNRYPLMIEQFMALGLEPNSPLPTSYPAPEFKVNQESQQITLNKLKLHKPNGPILALCAGAEFGPSKRWPEAYYAQVANKKLAEGWNVWLFGSKKDRPITEKLMSLTENRCENISDRADLSDAIDLLSLASGVVTNDSGLMHVAAALKKPLIALYGSTSPAFTPPLSATATIQQLNLACQPCFERVCPLVHHRCMRDLTAERVLKTITEWGF